MDQRASATGRILVVARPMLARSVEATLCPAGYEVHRTPGGEDLGGSAARLRPHLVVVALDLPWIDAALAVQPLVARPRPLPVLLLGEEAADVRLARVPRLPLALDAARLLAAVAELLRLAGGYPSPAGASIR